MNALGIAEDTQPTTEVKEEEPKEEQVTEEQPTTTKDSALLEEVFTKTLAKQKS